MSQFFSRLVPKLYAFTAQTYCDEINQAIYDSSELALQRMYDLSQGDQKSDGVYKNTPRKRLKP